MIVVRVNSETFTEYQNVNLNRSLNKPSGALTIEFSPTQISNIAAKGKKNAELPIKVNDLIQVLVDEVPKLTGYVDKISGSGSAGTHSLAFVVRDKTQDIIDSSVPPGAKNIERPLTLAQFCTTVISKLGATIPVIDSVPGLPPIAGLKDTLSGGSSSNCMGLLTGYARKDAVYLIPDGLGGLEIFRPSGISNGSNIINQIGGNETNVISYNFEVDYSKRYRKYVCKSQDNFGVDPSADYKTPLGTNRSGSVTDTEIRASRYLEIQGEQTLTDFEAGKRVKEEANLRRALSNSYSCVVQGHSSNKDIVWDMGQTASVADDFAQKQGSYTITEVTYSFDISSGSTTELNFADPDAFKVIPLLTDKGAAISGQNNQTITEKGGYQDNDWINKGQTVSITDTFVETVGE